MHARGAAICSAHVHTPSCTPSPLPAPPSMLPPRLRVLGNSYKPFRCQGISRYVPVGKELATVVALAPYDRLPCLHSEFLNATFACVPTLVGHGACRLSHDDNFPPATAYPARSYQSLVLELGKSETRCHHHMSYRRQLLLMSVANICILCGST